MVGRSSLLMFFVSVLMAGITNLASLYVARSLAIADYGRLVYFANLFLLAMLAFGFGLTAVVVSEVAGHRAKMDGDGLRRVFYSLLAFRLLTVAPLLLAGLGLAALTKDNLYLHVGVTAALAILMDFLLGALQGLQRANRAAIAYLVQPLLYLGLLLGGAAHATELAILALEASYGLGAIAVALFLTRTELPGPRPDLVSWARLRGTLSLSAQVYVVTLLQMAYTSYAVILLGGLGFYDQAAQLSVPLTLVRMLPLMMAPVYYTAFYPHLCAYVAKQDQDGARRHVGRFLEGIGALTLCATALMLVFPVTIIDLLYTGRYTSAWPLLVVLSPLGAILGIEALLTLTLLALGRARAAAVVLALRLGVFAALTAGLLARGNGVPAIWVAAAYLASAVIALALEGAACGRWSAGRLPFGRLGAFAVLALALAAAARFLLPELNGSLLAEAYKLGLAGVLLGVFLLLFLLGGRGVWAGRWRRLLMIGGLLGLLFVPSVALPRGVAHADDPLSGCAGAVEGQRVILIDCSPGFATSHDRLAIYPRAGARPDIPWDQQLNDRDAVWLFDVGARGQAALLIDFHPDGGSLVADLYDDGDGDGTLRIGQKDGRPVALENNGRWTVRVVAKDGWWKRGDKVNYNLDIQVNGPVRASHGSTFLYDVANLATDNQIDFEIHVRDTDGDGRPDLDWRQDYPGLPEDPRAAGFYRTSIMANFQHDEMPITGSLFWPYLGATVGPFNKDYNTSPPPIQVDWSRSKVYQVAEFVASRRPGNYFIYSINRALPGRTNATNFENPFAFYDLAGANDGWPDMSIRVEAWRPYELPGRRNATPVNIIEYTWDANHVHQWDYSLSLVGRQAITETIQFPEFAVSAVPPDQLPGWVSGQAWDAATFVQVEKPYWNSEHVYEWTVEQGDKVLPYEYLTGISNHEPSEAFQDIDEGFRGEYTFHLGGKPVLYFSPVDRKLHLRGAQAGQWNLGSGQELRYSNLGGGDYLNQWTLYENGRATKSLQFLAGQLIYSDEQGVWIKAADMPPALFEMSPPGSHDEWAHQRAQLERFKPGFAGDDLRTMFDEVAGPVVAATGARVRDLRPVADGFQFVFEVPQLEAREVPAVLPGLLQFLACGGPCNPPPAATWIDALKPGAYRVRYNATTGYLAERLTPPALELAPPAAVRRGNTALDPVTFTVVIRNRGHEDAHAVPVELLAVRDGGVATTVGVVRVDVPGDGEAGARLVWVPPAAGRWTFRARSGDAGIESAAIELVIARPAATDAVHILLAQNTIDPQGALVGLLLLVAGALAGALWLALWRQPRRASLDAPLGR